MDMVHNMMTTKHLSNKYWYEAVTSSIYIMNRCLTKSVKNKVSQEECIGMNHNISHLIFSYCVAYAHVLDELRKKLDNKGQNCIFFVTMKTQKNTSCMILSQGK